MVVGLAAGAGVFALSLFVLWRVDHPRRRRPVRRSPATGEVIGGVRRLEGETRPLSGKHRPARAVVEDVSGPDQGSSNHQRKGLA